MSDAAVHLAHCNIGLYRDVCKYGDPDCPTLIGAPAIPRLAEAAEAITDRESNGGHGGPPWVRLYFTTPGEEIAFLAALEAFCA